MKPTYQTVGGPAGARRPHRHTGPPRDRAGASVLSGWVLLAWLVALPLGTTAQEVLTGLALVTALFEVARRPALAAPGPLAAPVLLWVLAAWAQTLHPDGSAHLALARTWVATAAWSVPVLARAAGPGPWLLAGSGSASLITVLVVLQGAAGLGAPPGGLGFEGRGLYSHHLTLAYAWVPLCCLAWFAGWRRTAAWLAGGVLATGSAGAALGLALGGLAGQVAKARGRQAGQVAALVLPVLGLGLLPLSTAVRLAERSVLWSAGAWIGIDGGAPPGRWRQVVDPVHRALDAGFFFPQHAHDIWLQALAGTGPATWLALAWAGLVLLRRASPGLMAAMTALCIGGFTQDWLSDVEVARMVLVWASLDLAGALPGTHAPRLPSPGPAATVQPR